MPDAGLALKRSGLRWLAPVAFAFISTVGPLAAQQTASTTPTVSIVTDLAPGDLLNIRATASAFGVVLGRLPNGANLKNYGCSDVGGYKWCKVAEIGNEALAGWAPARYVHTPGEADPTLEASLDGAEPALTNTDAAPDQMDFADPAAAASAAVAPADTVPDIAVGANGDNNFVPGNAPEDTPAAAKPERPDAAPSVDLSARFGGPADLASGSDPAGAPAKSAGQAALEEAYRLAYAAREKSAGTPSSPNGVSASAPSSDASSPSTSGDDTGFPLPAQLTSVPSSRPVDVAPAEPQVEATTETTEPQVEAKAETTDPQGEDKVQAKPQATANPGFDVTGEIPCARYVGQPMTRCEAGIKRIADGTAEVTVSWPDGGTRIVSFKDGKPASANSRGAFRFTREGDLNMIRIGISERFEISDALPFGD